MENKILDMKYVIENGVDYDNLESEIFTDKLLDSESEIGHTGLVYESVSENQISGYAFYKDGYKYGYEVHFYFNGNIESVTHMKDSVADGPYKIWNEENILIEEGEYRLGIQTKYRKYNIDGQLIDEKKGPTDFQLEHIKIRESRNKI
ncbi:hypothetical protein NRP93_001126 [Clostridium botulinum]|nr:hypothetical protein [Clostridium botulinum]